MSAPPKSGDDDDGGSNTSTLSKTQLAFLAYDALQNQTPGQVEQTAYNYDDEPSESGRIHQKVAH